MSNMEQKIDKIYDIVKDLQGDLKLVGKELAEVRTTVYGNGKPGLKAEVQSLREVQDGCPALQEKLLSNRLSKKANLIQWIMVGVAIVALIIAIIK